LSAAIPGFASHLAALAEMIAILNHVRAADLIRFAAVLFHSVLLSPRAEIALTMNAKETNSVECQRITRHTFLL
jgi:hypothetical protein